MADDDDRRKRIEAARAALAAAYAADPAAVSRFNGRVAKIDAARKRERQRFEHLALGKSRPKVDPRALTRPAGMPRADWKVERQRLLEHGVDLEPGVEEAVRLREAWSHKQGNPETLEAAGTHTDSIAQLERNGTIDKEQQEWAAQIANVYRSIEADVGIKGASFEARVDRSTRPPVIAERIHRVRLHLAYKYWRDRIPAPKAVVLDMLVGDTIGYTVAAERHGIHNRKAKRLLLEAINAWPSCVAAAFSVVNQADVDSMNDARAPAGSHPPQIMRAASSPPSSKAPMAQNDDGRALATAGSSPLPPVDPEFLDDRGYFRPWSEVKDIIHGRISAMAA